MIELLVDPNACASLLLALAFLPLIGVTLIADGLRFHIPRGYLYVAVTFSAPVEAFNLLRRRKRRKLEAACTE